MNAFLLNNLSWIHSAFDFEKTEQKQSINQKRFFVSAKATVSGVHGSPATSPTDSFSLLPLTQRGPSLSLSPCPFFIIIIIFK